MSQIQPPSLAAVAKAVVNSGSDTNPLIDLFEKARAATSKTLPKDSWYLIVAATFLTTDGGHNWGELYKYLISEYGTTPEERKNINRRLRQIVIKAWCLIGIPRATDGYIALKKVEAPEDIADEWNREELVNNPEKAKAQGGSWFDKLFKEEKGPILQAMGSFPDLAFTIQFTVYGWYLGDLSVFGDVENELVVLASVMGQNGGVATLSHLRAIRRIGVSAADTRSAQSVVEMVAQYMGKDTSKWSKAQEVEHLFP